MISFGVPCSLTNLFDKESSWSARNVNVNSAVEAAHVGGPGNEEDITITRELAHLGHCIASRPGDLEGVVLVGGDPAEHAVAGLLADAGPSHYVVQVRPL